MASGTKLLSPKAFHPDLVNLEGSDLSGADLSGTTLYRARLCKADLSGADLRHCDLSRADLSGANLAKADLAHANLTEATLDGTNLTECVFFYTVLADVNLARVEGLTTTHIDGPLIINIDTLYRSEGTIPESFLRGCGLPEEFIRQMPHLLKHPIPFYSCFISYSHDDKAFATLLHDQLQSQGIRCWLDEHQLLPGDDLHEAIDRGVRLWDKVLLCASKASLTSWWVDGEINRAFQKEAQLMKERGKKVLALIPLNLDGFLFAADYQSGKKAEIKSRVAANFLDWGKDRSLFARELQKVIRALRADDSGHEEPPAPKL